MFGRKLSKNPRQAFTELHGFPPGPPVDYRYRLPKGQLVDLYKITRLEGDRVVDIGTGAFDKRFYHDFSPGSGPTLAADAEGDGYLLGGNYKITTHGIEDNPMHYMVRGRHGQFVHMRHYPQHMSHNPYHYGMQRNPWGPVVSGLVLIGGGLLGGLLVNAAIQALPARVGDTVKDGISLGVAALAVYIPSSMGGRLAGVAVAAALVGNVINRRTDATNKLVGWVHTQFARLYDRVGGMGMSGTNQVASGAQETRPVSGLGSGTDRFGLPTVQYSESYAGSSMQS